MVELNTLPVGNLVLLVALVVELIVGLLSLCKFFHLGELLAASIEEALHVELGLEVE